MGVSRRYIGLTGIFVLVILVSGCVSIGGFIDTLNMDSNSNNFTKIDENGIMTCYAWEVSFKCQNDWFINVIKDGERTLIAGIKINDSSSFQPQFMIDITSNNGKSEKEVINQAKKNIPFGSKTFSVNTITVDGNKAYKTIFNDPSGQSKTEQIVFVKKGKTYLITFSALDKEFDKERANFDMILNSLKIQ